MNGCFWKRCQGHTDQDAVVLLQERLDRVFNDTSAVRVIESDGISPMPPRFGLHQNAR